MSAAASRIRHWRESIEGPLDFVRENFHVEPDEWQKDALRALVTDTRIAMKACKGPGKTAFLAWAILWFMVCFPHPKVAATSITGDNLADNLWPELAKWMNKSPFLKQTFKWTKTRIVAVDHPETWWASARTWSKRADQQQQADALAGLHADYTLAVLDEAGGIPDAVMATAEATLSTVGGRHLLIIAGNPTHLEGPLYRACTNERHLWKLIEITGDPDDPKRSPRISIKWAREQIEKYGKDNPWVLVNVFGKFPPSSINTLLGPEDVTAAIKRHLTTDAYIWAQKRLGIDVARYGDDLTVIFPRQGLAAFMPVAMRHARNSAVSVDIANRVMLAKQRWHNEVEYFDDTVGWAHGAIDVMRSHGHSPFPVAFNGKAIDPRFLNVRCEIWWLMAQWVLKGGALPNVPELVRELTVPTYTYVNGKFVMEDKDQIKERLGWSPNYADALALTFASPDVPAAIYAGKPGEGGVQIFPAAQKSEWDPRSSEHADT